MKASILAAVTGACLLALPALAETQIQILTSDDAKLALGRVSFPGGRSDVAYSVGIGSAAFRAAKDPAFDVWTAGDRGPNFTCDEAEKLTGIRDENFCAATKGKGRIYPWPAYTPSLYRLHLDPAAGRFTVAQVLPLKTASGKPITGLLNPLKTASTENAYGPDKQPLPHDPSALDVEGLVRLTDGTFWIGEENAPSIAHIAADGTVLERWVPAGTEAELKDADYPVVGKLPALLAKRFTNRGIESMAVSPDEQFLYFILQNPLGNPDANAYRDARAARLFKLDRASGKILGEYAYEMDAVKGYPGEKDTARNSVVRISELTALGTDRLLVLERTETVTRLYEVKLAEATNIAGSPWDDAATKPSLEQTSDLAAAGVTALPKQLRLDTSAHKEIPGKIEGVTVLGDGRLMLINDDDFGIEGASTKIILVSGTGVVME